ncbi:MAG TPA: LuxR C-terminal-related transcriptional regulator [Nocardioides sp.]|nr:LuxR C-terminal-related transcriptional regulator [Nocardioides sp.]
MAGPLLETKLYVPAHRSGLVPRTRLSERLRRGLGRKLVLVSAPAGFGKTTLLAEWLDERTTAWLSLDQNDSDPATFWTYVVAAVRTAAPDVGAPTLALLQESKPAPVRLLLTTLINELDQITSDLFLVFDDYHVIDSLEVHEGVGFLLEHLPQRLHVVIVGRADPPLPLASLRARGELVEVRAADLRFTTDEAAAYLNDAMGLELTSRDVGALEQRTEGWIAALQLAALSMEGRDDPSRFIAGFAGDDRYVVDYLVEEVLRRQPEHVHEFLMRTSILDRMNGPLCDALTGQDAGRAMLENLDKRNLFLVPLDDRRQWYRYHHLFADVLRARLLDEHPDRVPELHRLASDWHESHGDRTEAIRHAMAGADFARAAELVELELPALRRERREATLRAWLEMLPSDVLLARPVLCMGLGGARMSTGTFEGVESLLLEAQRWLDEPTQTGMVVVDHDEFRRLPADVAFHRAGLALMQGDPESTVVHARRALDVALDDDHLSRGAASALLGLAAWGAGDLETAYTSYAESVVRFERIGHIADVLGCSITLADLQLTRGHLRDAMATFDHALRLASNQGGAVLRGTADMHVGRSALLYELDDVAGARAELARAVELGEHNGLPQNAYRRRLAMASLAAVEGDPDAADELLDEADRAYVGDFSPNVRPVPAVRARRWLAQGRVADARRWVDQQGLSATDELSYLREFAHLTLARVLMAEKRLDPALDLLARLARAAEEGQRSGTLIEIRVVQALAHQLHGDLPAALTALEAALALAESEGYVRTFVDEGPAMLTLLEAAAERGMAPRYVARLLGAFPSAPRPGVAPGLIEPLSDREQDVLRLLATELSGPEIARELVVSLNTVRSHTKSIYTKLGVNTRRTAVRRAQELGLLPR